MLSDEKQVMRNLPHTTVEKVRAAAASGTESDMAVVSVKSADSSGEDNWTFRDADAPVVRRAFDRLHIMPRDPTTAYVYWEVSEERMRMTERHFGIRWGELRKGLRVYDVNAIDFGGDEANRFWDNEVSDVAVHWFVRDLSPDCRYVVDYGVLPAEGGFFTLLRSGSMKLPPDRPFEEGGQSGRLARLQHDAARPAGSLDKQEPQWMSRFTGYSLH